MPGMMVTGVVPGYAGSKHGIQNAYQERNL
jgi:hypothetical protein